MFSQWSCSSSYDQPQLTFSIMAPSSSSSSCRCCGPCSRLCSRSSAYTLALGLGFVTLGTSRILLLKFSANEGNIYYTTMEQLDVWFHIIIPSIYSFTFCNENVVTTIFFLITENKYDFLPASVNLMAEAIKLVFCLVMSVRVVIRGESDSLSPKCHSYTILINILSYTVYIVCWIVMYVIISAYTLFVMGLELLLLFSRGPLL